MGNPLFPQNTITQGPPRDPKKSIPDADPFLQFPIKGPPSRGDRPRKDNGP